MQGDGNEYVLVGDHEMAHLNFLCSYVFSRH